MRTQQAADGLNAFTIFSAIIIISLLACFGTIMCCLFNPACFKRMRAKFPCCLRWNRVILGGLSFFKVCCGLICLMIGLLILTFSFVFANVCHFSHKGINDREFAAQVVNDTDSFRYMDLCMFKDSSGDLGELLPPTQQNSFKDLTDLFNGINVDYATINITESTTPSLESYETEIDDYISWKK
jgi:hypothetical protein